MKTIIELAQPQAYSYTPSTYRQTEHKSSRLAFLHDIAIMYYLPLLFCFLVMIDIDSALADGEKKFARYRVYSVADVLHLAKRRGDLNSLRSTSRTVSMTTVCFHVGLLLL